jgi:hypothetical protein
MYIIYIYIYIYIYTKKNVISFLSICLCTTMLIAAFLIIAKLWYQHRCSLYNEYIKKKYSSHSNVRSKSVNLMEVESRAGITRGRGG